MITFEPTPYVASSLKRFSIGYQLALGHSGTMNEAVMPDSAYAAIALASAGPTRLNWGILSSSPCTRFQCAATAAGTRHTVRSLGSNTSALDKPSAPSRISAVPGAHLAKTCMSAAAAHSWISRVVFSNCSLLPEPLLMHVLVHRLSVVYMTRSPRSKC